MRRMRRAKIVATVGRRLNFSHGTQAEHRSRFEAIRAIEKDLGRPIGILMDLQGPKLRVGTFGAGFIELAPGQRFHLDLDAAPGDSKRVGLPHPEIFAALKPDTSLLLDDGKLRVVVKSCGAGWADTEVLVGGRLSDRKGVNVPDVVLPVSPLTAKDCSDLEFGLSLGADWVALSFVQRVEDIDEARTLIGESASVMAKIEKPAAIECLDAIVDRCDGLMAARGDLGVEMPPEDVPTLQRSILRSCRRAGKPCIVATQMLESMISAPVPTRAEASDVATAVYEGADAVMLSAESASGKYPVEAVAMMDRIIRRVEADPHYRSLIDSQQGEPESTAADAICSALRHAAHLVSAKATITSSGFSSRRAARERPEAPILSLTPSLSTARRLALVWGVHSVHSNEAPDTGTMTDMACRAALREGFAQPGDNVVIAAGYPFGHSGTTNMLRIANVWPADKAAGG
jgi:pyruvate kinase